MPQAEPQRRLPRVLAGATALLLAARVLSPEPKSLVQWVPLEVAVHAARQSRKPILYYFSAEWCSPCRKLERTVFASAQTAREVGERFVPVKVMDREQEEGKNPPAVEELQKRFNVSGFPTLVVARTDGSLVARVVGLGGGASSIRRFLSRSSLDAHRPRPAAGS